MKTIDTNIGKKLDFSEEFQSEFKKAEKYLEDFNAGMKKWEDFSEDEKKIIGILEERDGEIWNILGVACSFYCGAGNYTVKTSSSLQNYKSNTYDSSNLTDFNYKTAWVEGNKSNGVGETIEFSFDPTHPRVTKVIIVNGYIKSKATWENNSRVKSLKMFVNNKPYAIINLKDIYAEQYFPVDTLGNSERENFEALKLKPRWNIKFEILEVYEGKKYNDLVITEIYFDGIDVH
jgi:hypothetical protein